MESAGLRHRHLDAGTLSQNSPGDTAQHTQNGRPSVSRRRPREKGNPVPKFTIDLALAPEDRYSHVAPHFLEHLAGSDLTGLFIDLVSALVGGPLSRFATRMARLALRRLHDPEETAELRGICSATGVPMYILVAFNVLLDLLLGCTSGAVRVVAGDDGAAAVSSMPPGSRMMHFRTLDWGMDELRRLVVEFDFVRGAGTPVVATTVTYFGYVGVLTGARKGLTMSLNFRPHHCRATWRRRAAFRCHQALVVLGFRQSISSALRRILLDPAPAPWIKPLSAGDSLEEHHLTTILSELSRSPGTAAYLILCTPQRVYVVEKDHRSALIRDSDVFLAAYNHDFADETDPPLLADAAEELANSKGDAIGMADLVAYSLDRKAHLDRVVRKRVKACRRASRHDLDRDAVAVDDVMTFIRDKEICNEETHYAVVMDPESGAILWRRMYPVS